MRRKLHELGYQREKDRMLNESARQDLEVERQLTARLKVRDSSVQLSPGLRVLSSCGLTRITLYYACLLLIKFITREYLGGTHFTWR